MVLVLVIVFWTCFGPIIKKKNESQAKRIFFRKSNVYGPLPGAPPPNPPMVPINYSYNHEVK